jgi:PST family polysaccharide transporter
MSTIGERFTLGAGWLFGHRWIDRLLDFAAIVVLARLLSPEDFGLVAIAASVAAIVEGLSAFDVNKALIQARDDDRALYDSAWTLSVLRGLLSAICMLLVIPFLSDPRLAAVLAALSLTPLFNGLANPRFVMFERQLIYSKLAVQTLTAKIVAVAITLTLAVVYRNYWSLVVGLLAGSLMTLMMSYLLRPYRPRFSWDRAADIFGFSGWLTLTSIVTTLSMETDKIIVGRLLGVVDTGLYYMTQRVGVLPTRELVSPLQRILFPSFSELADDRPRFRRVVGESINVLAGLSLAAGFGFALVANDFVPLVLGDQWIVIVPLLKVLTPYLGLRATLSMTLPCVMALAKTRLLFWVSFAYALVHLPAFIAGTAFFGLAGAIWSIVLAGVLYSYLNAWMLKRTLEISIGEIFTWLRRPLLAATVMVLAVLGLDALLPLQLFSEDGSWLALALKVTFGASVYCLMLYASWRLEGRPAGLERRLMRLRGR